MGIYNSSKFMGNCWSRERGYHTPTTPTFLKPHMRPALTAGRREQPADRKPEADAVKKEPQEQGD